MLMIQTDHGPAYDMLILCHMYANTPLSAHADVASGTRGLKFGQFFIFNHTLSVRATNVRGDCAYASSTSLAPVLKVT